uniref:Uncharacterized protein n=1 Tax=Plectus sambesii TaxID=2011161 RepID=A0A914W8Z6_9BILA
MNRSENQRNDVPEGRKSQIASCFDAAKEVIIEAAEKTKELAHDVKETIIGHEQDSDKQVTKAVENFEDLKQQLADEEEELREIQRREEIALNTRNNQEFDALKDEEEKVKRLEFETKAQIAQASEEYKCLRTEQLRKKAEQEKIIQLTHPNDQDAVITEMIS